MSSTTRRSFVELAASLGAAAAWGGPLRKSKKQPRERRDLFPQGVASGDPESTSVLLWTRRPPVEGHAVARLNVEIAEDSSFDHVVARATAPVSAASDWTCRVLAGG